MSDIRDVRIAELEKALADVSRALNECREQRARLQADNEHLNNAVIMLNVNPDDGLEEEE